MFIVDYIIVRYVWVSKDDVYVDNKKNNRMPRNKKKTI